MPAANVSDQAIPWQPRSTAASRPALSISMYPSADAPSRKVPAIIVRRQSNRFTIGAMNGMLIRLATPKAAMTAPICPAVAP